MQVEGSKRAEWRAHWKLVMASCIAFSFTSALAPAVGVFMGPIGQAFSWNRTQLSIGFALAGLLSILTSPLLGSLIDRWGARRIALPGIVLTALAVAAFSQLSGSIAQWIGLWLIWGTCSILIQSTVWSTAVAGLFSAGRGLALGFTLGGAALSQIVAPPLTNTLIEHFGWRTAFIGLGFGWGGVAFVLAFLFFYDAHDVHRRSASTGTTETKDILPGLAIGDAWRSWALWRVAISTFLILTVSIAVTVHQFPIVVEAGASRDLTAYLISLAGVAGIAGKLITGSLLDRFHARWIGGVTLASTAVAYPLMMSGVGSLALVVIGVMISGYAAGTKIQLCGYLTARYGGLRNYGTIFGFMTSIIALASMVGPLLAGAAHDRFGSYAPLLMVGVVASIISGGLVFSLGRYPDWRKAEAEEIMAEMP